MKGKPEKMLRWINDVPRNAAMNMALDEMLFNEYKNNPVLRTYYWDNTYTTIGYFQKVKDTNGYGLIRRFTGGLTVTHHNDTAYSVIISSDFFNVYNQQKIYRNIHLSIQKALQTLGINSIILDEKAGNTSNICIQTFCKNDLILNGKKIAGSCLRRRGSKLIVQGSIHIHLNDPQKKVFAANFVKNTSEFLKIQIKTSSFDNNDIKQAQKIAREKYSNSQWNNKF
jgi:lipoate-protein ligase A